MKPVQFQSEDLLRCVRRPLAACPRLYLVQTPTPLADLSRPDQWPHSQPPDQGPTRTWTDASRAGQHQSCSHRRDDHSPPRGHDAPRADDPTERHRNTPRLPPTRRHHYAEKTATELTLLLL